MGNLKRKLDELFERGKSFFENIERNGRVAIVYHKDVDGIVSAALTLAGLKKVGIDVSKIIPSANDEIENVLNKLRRYGKIIILDLDICYLKVRLHSLGNEILLIDHHPPRSDLNNKKIVYINSRLANSELYQPTSYLVYKLFSTITTIEEFEWLAVIGTVGDYGLENCRDLLNRWVKVVDKRALRKTKLWKIVMLINGSITQLGYGKVLKILLETKSTKDLETNKIIVNAYRKYIIKFKEFMAVFLKNSQEYKKLNLIISTIKSKERTFGSVIATEMSMKYPEKIIVLLRKKDKKYTINARYQNGKINMGEVVRRCCRGLDGGGGHRHAAGATINVKYLELFKKRLIKELQEKMKRFLS